MACVIAAALLAGCGGSSSPYVFLNVQERAAWGPNGRVALTAVGGDGNLYIWTIGEGGGGSALLTPQATTIGLPAGGTNPAYSHDGTTIVFSGRRATRVALYTMSATSGESGGLTALTDTNVVTTTGRDVEPWYVNGTTVVYSSNQNTPNMALWQVDTGTKVATKLAEQPGYDMMWAAPDPTGSGIIVYQRKDAVSGRSQIWKRAADGTLSALIPGSDDGNDYGGPSYKPDGSLILFHSNRGGDYDIWSISSTGGTPTQITNTNDSDGFPVFKPDSTKIGFIRGNEFWTMDPTGTNQTRITQVFR
jgi:Tol biopolymer transport system component